MQNLSGGELQRVAMTLCLGKPADVYLIDEPSAYLDSEQRLVAAKVGRLALFYSECKSILFVNHYKEYLRSKKNPGLFSFALKDKSSCNSVIIGYC